MSLFWRSRVFRFIYAQRWRIAITRALALEPKLIICDEVVSALDVSIQAHGLPFVRDFAHRVFVMKSGKIVEKGSVDQIFNAPREEYTCNLIAESLSPDPDLQAKRRAAIENQHGVAK